MIDDIRVVPEGLREFSPAGTAGYEMWRCPSPSGTPEPFSNSTAIRSAVPLGLYWPGHLSRQFLPG